MKATVLDNVQQAQDAERVFRQLASQGHQLVIGTTFSQYATLRKLAPSLGKTSFECCAGIDTLKNLGVFEARSYEGTYLTGIAAGKMTKSNVLGWVGAFPVPQVIYNLNGFFLFNGERAKLDELRRTDAFESFSMKLGMQMQGYGVVPCVTGEGLKKVAQRNPQFFTTK